MTFLTHMQFHGLKTKIPALLEFMLGSPFLIFPFLLETFAYILGPGVLFRWSLELTEKLVSERQQAGVVGQPKWAKGGEEEAKNLPMETVPEAAITTANERVLAADDFNSGLGSEPAFVRL
jgi:hypothetical protein